MDREHAQIREMKQKLAKYQKLQKIWTQQKQTLTKSITLMQQQIAKHKAVNINLLKKSTNHKRSCSDEQTFIFNQTNISSYYPIVMLNKTNNWIPKANLRSHLDSIRTLFYQGQFLLSAGQDCLLKIWERDKLKITVREHLAPVFTICGDSQSVFTAGAEGVVRQWSVINFMENGRPVNQGEFHQDSIWEMVWNGYNQVLVTSGADGVMKIIQTSNNVMKQVYQFVVQPETPTSVAFVSDEKIVSGFAQSSKLSIFQLQKTKKICDIYYQSKDQLNQVNKVLENPRTKTLITAHEDRSIRLFDQSSGKLIKTIVAHSDSVTSLTFRPHQQNQLVSCSHDGTLRFWDLRKYKCINDIGIHMKKYDQSLLCLAHANTNAQGAEEEQVIAVGGADGQIKLICPEN